MLFAMYVVGSLFIARVIVGIRGMSPGTMSNLTGYVIVVAVATVLLLVFAQSFVVLQYWWLIAATILITDFMAFIVLWAAGARPIRAGEMQ